MKTITKEITNEIIINKSKFITIILPIININEIDEQLINIKNKYSNATHYCYAYIINSKEKCSDDGEPGGTAGMPILNVLKNNDLTNILCVVVRYFGGIKLGAGGLVRAYSTSTSEVLNKCTFGTLTQGFNIIIEFDYDNIKNIDYILKNIDIKKSFDKKITYTFQIEENKYQEIENNLKLYLMLIKKEKTIIIKDDN